MLHCILCVHCWTASDKLYFSYIIFSSLLPISKMAVQHHKIIIYNCLFCRDSICWSHDKDSNSNNYSNQLSYFSCSCRSVQYRCDGKTGILIHMSSISNICGNVHICMRMFVSSGSTQLQLENSSSQAASAQTTFLAGLGIAASIFLL